MHNSSPYIENTSSLRKASSVVVQRVLSDNDVNSVSDVPWIDRGLQSLSRFDREQY